MNTTLVFATAGLSLAAIILTLIVLFGPRWGRRMDEVAHIVEEHPDDFPDELPPDTGAIRHGARRPH